MRMAQPGRCRHRLQRLIVTAAIVVAAGVLATGEPSAASTTNTRIDPPGTVELPGSAWLNGAGVDVYSNGSSVANDAGANYVTVNGQQVFAGERWQCVELINRLYLTRGWITTTWHGYGNTIYANTPANLTKQPNGSITYLDPGDVVTLDDGGNGHAGIVESVAGSTVTLVNQNTTAVYSTATLTGGTLTMNGWAGYTVQGVIHAPINFNTAQYIGHVVKWNNGPGTQDTSWVVSSDGKRYWIPDTSTYYCAVNIGFTDVGEQTSTVLNQVPDSGVTWHCPVAPRGTQDTLSPGQGLYQGQALTSSDGRFNLYLQNDHNLVEYGPHGVVWATNVWTGGFVILQHDCNFVGYNQWDSPQWASHMSGSNCTLILQNDGNLVEYGNGGRGAGVIWATDHTG